LTHHNCLFRRRQIMSFKRPDGRKPSELRKVEIIRRYTRYAPGSVLMSMGETTVLCTATFEQGVPPWLQDIGGGWLTAEYGMLPSSTPQRRRRTETHPDGRTQEIRRLIGRALRAVVDLDLLADKTVWIDCDVLQADGGTRTASITGAYVALVDAVNAALKDGLLTKNPITGAVAAVSVGIVRGRAVVDLNYAEDSTAEVDVNVVMTDAKQFVEIQGTAEHGTFDDEQLGKMLRLARTAIGKLLKAQKLALEQGANR